jgi:hypothetical protein
MKYIKRSGVRKCFHIGGNSSCRQHIRGHYDLYKARCEDRDVKMNDWAMPRALWKEKKKHTNPVKEQTTLDGQVEMKPVPKSFTREGILEAVASHIVCDDQALSLAGKATFRNCLVAMRPRTTTADIPSTHDVTVFIHNQFADLLDKLKDQISVRCSRTLSPSFCLI